MKVILQFFIRLFGFNRKKTFQDKDIFKYLFSSFFEYIFFKITGVKTLIDINECPADNFINELKDFDDIISINIYFNDDIHKLCLYFSKNFLSSFKTKNNISTSDIEFIENLGGYVKKIAIFNEQEESDNICIKVIDNYKNKNIIYWKVLSSKTLKVNVDNDSFYALVENNFNDMILKSDKLISLKKNKFLNYIESCNPTQKIDNLTINKQNEFLIADFFIPNFLFIHQYSIFFKIKNFSLLKDISLLGLKTGIWVIFIYEIDNKKNFVLYYFDYENVNKFNNDLIDFKLFIKEILKGVIKKIKERTGIEDIKISIQFIDKINKDLFTKIDLYSIKYKLKMKNKTIESLVFFPRNIFLQLKKTYYTKKNIEDYNNDFFGQIISFNHHLLNNNFDDYINLFVPHIFNFNIIPFYNFINLIDDFDLKKVVQNFLIQKYNHYEILKLFFIKDINGMIIEFDFDTDRIYKFLPKLKIEDIESIYNTFEPLDEENFKEFNKKVIKDLYVQVENNKLLLSNKALFILSKGYYEKKEKQGKNEINSIINNYRLFNKLNKIPKNDLSILLHNAGTQKLCSILLFNEEQKELILKIFSNKKQKQLNEDLDYFITNYEQGLLPVEKIKNNVIKFIDNVENYLSRDRKGI